MSLRSFDQEGLSGTRSGGGSASIPADEVLSVTFEGRALAGPSRAAWRADLIGGDSVFGHPVKADEEILELQVAGAGVISLPIDHVRALVVLDHLPGDGREYPPVERKDTVYLMKSGGRVDFMYGTLVSIAQRGNQFYVVLDCPLGPETAFHFSEVIAVALPPVIELAPVSGVAVTATLTDGSRLTGSPRGWKEGALVIETRFGAAVKLRATDLLQVSFQSDRFVHLSDLEPCEIEQIPAFGSADDFLFPMRKDEAVTGGPIRVFGRFFAKGLGVHARCVVTYDLEGGGYTAFTSFAGIDDSVAALKAKGAVVFRVLVDGSVVHDSGVVRGGEAAKRVPRIPLAGARRLTLEVDFGPDFDVADRAVWAQPVLVK